MSEPIRRWLFNVYDENGEAHSLGDQEFIGTFDQASRISDILADGWEIEHGGFVLKVECESHGIVLAEAAV